MATKQRTGDVAASPTAFASGSAEYFSDDHRESHIKGLIAEGQGYSAKVRGAREDGDDATAARYEARLRQVNAELARIGADATLPVERAAKRASSAKKTDDDFGGESGDAA